MKNNNQEIAILTVENAHLASTIININNPEWGSKRFNHNAQPLNDGECCSTFGTGSNSAVLFEHEYKFWNVASWKN